MASRLKYVETTHSGLDSGVINSTSSSFTLGSIENIAYHIKQASGTLAGAQFIIECSDNGSDWYSILESITTAVPSGVSNIVVGMKGLTTLHVRLKVYTASTVASTVDVKLVS